MKTEPQKEHGWLQTMVGEWTIEGEATTLMALRYDPRRQG